MCIAEVFNLIFAQMIELMSSLEGFNLRIEEGDRKAFLSEGDLKGRPYYGDVPPTPGV